MTVFRRALYGSAVCLVGITGVGVSWGQATGSRLHQLDESNHALLVESGSVSSVISVLKANLYDTDIASTESLGSDIFASEAAFIAHTDEALISDLDVAVAFDAWRNLISDSDITHTSPVDLHRYRMFLSGLAPSLVTKDSDGSVSLYLSPVEAIYLFDFLIAHGAIPPANPSMPRKDLKSYRSAYNSYLTSTGDDKRTSDLQEIIQSYLLKTDAADAASQ